jgi:hypothetical protein
VDAIQAEEPAAAAGHADAASAATANAVASAPGAVRRDPEGLTGTREGYDTGRLERPGKRSPPDAPSPIPATVPSMEPMNGHDPRATVAENYRRFARREVSGRSPLYVELSEGVAADAAMLAFLAEQPFEKRQPNLLLATVRFLYGTQPDYPMFRSAVLENPAAIAATLAARRTQTNEPARCAALLPLLALLPQPLALLEVGAAAGLCLLPDRYAYRYGSHAVGSGPPVFACEPHGDVPLPPQAPQVVWRVGIDLEPIDLRNAEEVRWLEALVWPGQPGRLERLREAIEVARADPPRIVQGDLVERLCEVAGEAPPGATLVVFHTAVLAYLDAARRAEFAGRVDQLGATWISNESPGVTPGVAAAKPRASERGGHFLIAQGRRPVAFCDPHGAWVQWLAT